MIFGVRVLRLVRITHQRLPQNTDQSTTVAASNISIGGLDIADVQVTCINKQPRDNTHEGITHLGGAGWKWPRQQVIDSINAKSNTFYTREDGKRADIGVVNGPNGQYVRTYADGQWTDNLLALAECN